jgi:DHA1 family multidrug resistance protein B-like MFS transporter
MKKFFALHRTVRIRLGLAFVSKLIDAMILTFIAIYLAARVGLALTGALILVFAVFAVFGMLAGGHISERRGRRPVLIAGDLIGCTFLVLMATAYYGDWGPLAVYFSYAIAKFGSNMALPANDATIIDVTPPADRKYVYTVSYWVVNLALGAGALAGGFLYNSHFGAVIIGGAIGLGGALIVTVLFVSETKPESAAAEPSARRTGFRQFVDGYRVVLVDSTFRRLIIAASLALTLEGQMNSYIGIRLSDGMPKQHLLPFLTVGGVQMLGLLKAENTIMVVILALFVNGLLRPVSDRIRLYAGIAMYTAGFAVLAVDNTPWVLLLACLVLTFGEAGAAGRVGAGARPATLHGRVLPPHPVRSGAERAARHLGRGPGRSGDGRDLPALRRRDHPPVPDDPGPPRNTCRSGAGRVRLTLTPAWERSHVGQSEPDHRGLPRRMRRSRRPPAARPGGHQRVPGAAGGLAEAAASPDPGRRGGVPGLRP